ncbi:MAG: dihydrolipoyl dehydrogenase, partial [Solirubrobacterales bacterium]
VAAIRAAQVGLKTAVVEREETLGGRCLNVACIPAKAMLRAADVLTETRDGAEFGISTKGLQFEIKGAASHRDKVVKTLTGGVAGLMKKDKIDVITGTASLAGKGRVAVDGKEVETDKVVLATGSVSLPIPGTSFEGRVLDTEGMWLLNEQPARLAVIGAGASGAEIASAFGRFGTEVVLIEMLDQILPLEDAEIAKVVASELRKQNVKVVTGARVENVKASAKSVELDWGDGVQSFDCLCIAAGRAPDVEALGLEAAGVKTGERGMIEVDERLRTSADGVWAIGDLVHGPALAHKASEEGVIAVEDAAGKQAHPLDYDAIPGATFCMPQVASFGFTEEEARERGADVVVGRFPMGGVGAPTVYGDRKGMVKIVGDARYGELLGAHIVGARATEMIAELVVAKELEGGFEEVARTIHPHPTFSEAVMEGARATAGWAIHA